MTATTDAPTSSTGGAPTTHQGILAWVTEIAELTQPDAIHWCTGSDEEWAQLTAALEATGTFTRLNPEIKPNSFHAASDPTDVARVEDRTYICSVDEKDCRAHQQLDGPERDEGPHARAVRRLHEGPHDVRHPVRDGPPRGRDSPMFGVEVTDSAYVTVSMRVMARMGTEVLRRMEEIGAGRQVGPRAALGRHAARPRARPTSRGRATTPSTSSSSPRSG